MNDLNRLQSELPVLQNIIEQNEEKYRFSLLEAMDRKNITYPKFIAYMSSILFVEMAEILYECLTQPQDIPHIREYLQLKMRKLCREKAELKQEYRKILFDLSHQNLYGKSSSHWISSKGRDEIKRIEDIIALNLRYWDLKYLYHSYEEGYHKDKKNLYHWLLQSIIVE